MPKIAKNPETNRPWTRKTLRKAWIKALRSGEYKQTKNKLRAKGTSRFCCLGVLCDVYDPSGWVDKKAYQIGVEKECYAPPNFLFDLVHFHNAGKNCESLTNLNDKKNLSFKQIADILEKGEFWGENA